MSDSSDKLRPAIDHRFAKTPNPPKASRRIPIAPKTEPPRKFSKFKLDDIERPSGFSRIDIDVDDKSDVETTSNDEEHIEVNSNLDHANRDSVSTDSGELTLIAAFDDLMDDYDMCCMDEGIVAVVAKLCVKVDEKTDLWQKASGECERLQKELDKANNELGDCINKLSHARKLLDKEKKLRLKTEQERNNLERQMQLARDLLFSDQYKNRLPEDTREKLAFLNNTSVHAENGVPTFGTRLNTINEINSNEMNSTGSLLSDLSYSRSEDDLDTSVMHRGRQWVKHRPAPTTEEPIQKKRRSSGKVVEINQNDKIIATTTVEVTRDGPVTATSIIESVPLEVNTSHREKSFRESLNRSKQELINRSHRESLKELHIHNHENKRPSVFSERFDDGKYRVRQHSFVPKTVIRPDICGPCNKKIRFGKIVVRCKDCRGVCHNECKDKLPLPCIPVINTPTQKGVIGTIADYAPSFSPMVPAIIVHCINEIELRGLSEVGIYRVPGSEKEVRLLKEKFLRGKGAPMLNEIDVHVICGVVKDFLRSLHEPLVSQALWKEFISAAEVRSVADVPPIIYGAIAKLPQPNRDTLAYMIYHLQKVAESRDCKMPISNLAKVFGPTIIGYSSQDLDHEHILTETRQQAIVLEYLLELPNEFWKQYVNVCTPEKTPTIQQTPSTGSLLRSTGSRGFFTAPYSARSLQSMRKQRKFFGTPPSVK